MSINFVDLKPLSDWLHANPEWGIFMAFLFAFLESIAIIGLIMPGAVLMGLIGILVGAGYIPLVPTILWAASGAFVGDVLSFFLGYYFRGRLHQVWPFTKIPRLLQSTETFFTNHGGKGIFIGRFVGPVRPVLPLIAGTLSMSIPRFLIVDLISSLIWAPAYMLPGIIIGAASLVIAPHATSRIMLFLVGVIITGWLLFWLTKNISIYLINLGSRFIQSTWCWLKHKTWFSKLRVLLTPHFPDDHTQFSLAVFFFLALIGFVATCIAVLESENVFVLNLAFYHFFRSLYNPLWHKIMVMCTLFYEPPVLCTVWVSVTLYLGWRKHWQAMLHWMLLGAFTIGFGGIIKRLLDIPRPAGISFVPDSGSFPSGHVLVTASFLCFLAVLCKKDKGSWGRYFAIVLAIVSVVLVSFSRLYLCAHWLSDIVGALLLAASLVLFFTVSYRRHHPTQIAAAPLLAVALLTQFLAWSFVMFTSFDQQLSDYSPQYPSFNVSSSDWWQYGLKDHPLFRNNRFGTPVQTINIEWLGDLSLIKQNLEVQGWQAKFMSPLIRTLNYFGAGDHSTLLPLFPVVYEGEAPVLVMAKLVGNPKRLLILRLWRSDANVTDTDYRIWIGTLNYQHNNGNPLLTPFMKRPVPPLTNLTPVTNAFSIYLNQYEWKKLDYTDFPALNDTQDLDWDGYVLLIRTKATRED